MKPQPRALSEYDLQTLQRLLRTAHLNFEDLADARGRLQLSREQLREVEATISNEILSRGLTGGEMNDYGRRLDSLLGEVLRYLWATEG